MSQTYANQVTTDSSTGAVLTFSNIQVSEVDDVGPGLSEVDTESGTVLPIAGFQAYVPPGSTAQDGLLWSGFTDIVAGGVASVTLTFSYTITVSGAATITGLQQDLVVGQNSGNPGNVAQAVETITDSNGNAVAALSGMVATPSASATLATGYTTLNVTDVLTVSVNDPGDTYTNYAFIGVGAVEQSVSLTATLGLHGGLGGGLGNPGGNAGTPGTIVCTAFTDSNHDGTQASGESGINAVAVTLENASGGIVQTACTDGSGVSMFSNLAAGDYTVVFASPAGDETTTPVTESLTVTTGGTVAAAAGFAVPIAAVVCSGQTSSGITLYSGDTETVHSGGTASATTVNSGGHEYVSAGGIDRLAVLNGGKEFVYGTASGTAVGNGGGEWVLAGGTAQLAVVGSGGMEVVSSGGLAIGTAVGSGGNEYVYGTASATTVNSGGHEYVSAGGIDQHSLIGSGGMAFISSAGTVSGGTVISGGTITVGSGASVLGGLTIAGGTAMIAGSMASGQAVTFTGSGGDLALSNLPAFAAAISGFATGDAIDLGGFAFSGAETRAFAEAGSNTSGTLSVIAGGKTASLTLAGTYGTSSFALSSDGAGGTFVKFV